MEIIAILIIGLCFLILIVRNLYAQKNEFKLLPTREEYAKSHPNCETNRGMKCCHCHSSSIKNWGKDKADSAHRLFICNHCGVTLYRSDTVFIRATGYRREYGANEKNPWLDE